MADKRPKCYKDWRAIYQSETYLLGAVFFSARRLRETGATASAAAMARYVNEHYQRLVRLDRRMDVERRWGHDRQS
jgi:hypothetical protein